MGQDLTQAGMLELVDKPGRDPGAAIAWGFKSLYPHQKKTVDTFHS